MADANTAIGLDIGEKTVKFVKIRQTNGDFTLLRYDIKDIPSGQERIRAVSEILKELFKSEKGDAEVYTCAFGPNVSLKRITIPQMPDGEIASAMKWEAKNLATFPLENAAVDFFKIGKTTEKASDKIEIMLIMASEEVMNFFSAVSKESGVKFAGISVLPLALRGLLFKQKRLEQDKVTAVIDIGSDAASINLFKGNTLQFTREISVAGESFTKAMTGLLVADHWQLNLTYEQSEDIKHRYGIPPKDTSELTENGIPLVHIYEMMFPTLKRLQNEIMRSFDYFKEQFREEKIDNIFLTGGSSGMKNLSEHLSNALGIKVETIDPLENAKIDPKSDIKLDEVKKVASRLSLAVGLAIDRSQRINLISSREKEGGFKVPFNLQGLLKMPGLPGIPSLPEMKVRIPANMFVWIAVILIGASIFYDVKLTQTRNQLRKELSSKQSLLSDIRTLVERRSILNQILKEGTNVKDTLYEITQVLPPHVYLTELLYENAARQMVISGDAPDTQTVGQTMSNIEESPYFSGTTLIETRKGAVNNMPRQLFRMSFKVD